MGVTSCSLRSINLQCYANEQRANGALKHRSFASLLASESETLMAPKHNQMAAALATPITLPAPPADVNIDAGAQQTTHTFSLETLAYLEKVAAVAVALWQAWKPGRLPAFRIMPGLALKNARGNAAGDDASTYTVVPPTMDVTTRRDAILDPSDVKGKAKIERVVSAKNGTPDTHKVSNGDWLIFLSILKHPSQSARATNETRTTAALVQDVIRGLFHASAGFAPGFAHGKLEALKTLNETMLKSAGFALEPIHKPMMTTVDGKRVAKLDDAGKAITRADWTRLAFPRAMAETMAQHILSSSLPDEPPAELRLDLLNFQRDSDRAQTSPYAAAETTVNGQAIKVRVTIGDLQKLLATVDDGVDTFAFKVVRFDADAIKRAKAHITSEQYKAARRGASVDGTINLPGGETRLVPSPGSKNKNRERGAKAPTTTA
jgi:hypothetical protein